MTTTIKLGILGSTRGTVMLSILEAIKENKLNAEISVVISDQPKALILEHAHNEKIPSIFVSAKDLTRTEFDQKISNLLLSYQVDLIVLVGFMRILSKEFTDRWAGKVINIHPALLPKFARMMDINVHQAVLNENLSETGCTVHYVTEDLDAGEVLLQKKCNVLPNDSIETLKSRVQELESRALIEVLQSKQQQKQKYMAFLGAEV